MHLKKSSISIILMAALTLISFATALTVISLDPEKLNVWLGTYADTDFTILSSKTILSGRNKVKITIELKNTDTVAHSANVTVQLLDSNGDIILESSQLTGTVDGDNTVTLRFTFTQTDLVYTFESYLIEVKQVS